MAKEKQNNVDSPQMLEQLKQRVQQLWDEITPHNLRRLYHQIPQLIRLLCRMPDYPTKYQSLISYEKIAINISINYLFFFVE